jgi:hypothetical protein
VCGTGANVSRCHLATGLISGAPFKVIPSNYSVVNDIFFQLFVG